MRKIAILVLPFVCVSGLPLFVNNDSIVKSQVPKGTFKNAETGEIFSYVDNFPHVGHVGN